MWFFENNMIRCLYDDYVSFGMSQTDKRELQYDIENGLKTACQHDFPDVVSQLLIYFFNHFTNTLETAVSSTLQTTVSSTLQSTFQTIFDKSSFSVKRLLKDHLKDYITVSYHSLLDLKSVEEVECYFKWWNDEKVCYFFCFVLFLICIQAKHVSLIKLCQERVCQERINCVDVVETVDDLAKIEMIEQMLKTHLTISTPNFNSMVNAILYNPIPVFEWKLKLIISTMTPDLLMSLLHVGLEHVGLERVDLKHVDQKIDILINQFSTILKEIFHNSSQQVRSTCLHVHSYQITDLNRHAIHRLWNTFLHFQ